MAPGDESKVGRLEREAWLWSWSRVRDCGGPPGVNGSQVYGAWSGPQEGPLHRAVHGSGDSLASTKLPWFTESLNWDN